MCRAKELVLQLDNILKELEFEYKKSKAESLRLESARQDILHHMENGVFDAVQGYKYAKSLQLVSKERRIMKDEYDCLEILFKKINPIKSVINGGIIKSMNELNRREGIRNKGYEAYNPRVLGEIDKNDVISQVVDLINSSN